MLPKVGTPEHGNGKMSNGLPITRTAEKLFPMADCYFAEWGLEYWVYIKPIQVDGQRIYAIFAANGQQMGLAEDRNTARETVIQENLTPLSLH